MFFVVVSIIVIIAVLILKENTIIFFLFEDKNSEEISSSLMPFAANHIDFIIDSDRSGVFHLIYNSYFCFVIVM